MLTCHATHFQKKFALTGAVNVHNCHAKMMTGTVLETGMRGSCMEQCGRDRRNAKGVSIYPNMRKQSGISASGNMLGCM